MVSCDLADMPKTSVYRYFRPMMVLCSVMGHFPVSHVTAISATLLKVKFFTISGLVFIIVQFCILGHAVRVCFTYFANSLSDLRDIYTTLTFTACDTVMVSIFLGTNDIVKAFQAVDNLRETHSMLPAYLTPKPLTPKVISWLALGLLLAFHVSVFVVTINMVIITPFSIAGYIIGNSMYFCPYRQMLVLSCLFYTCSLVVDESARAWLLYREIRHKSVAYTKMFCQLLSAMADILKYITSLLAKHILVLLISHVYSCVSALLYDAQLDTAEATYLVRLLGSSVLCGLLIYCVDATSDKFTLISQEVFVTEMSDVALSKRDAARVKLLITQLQFGSEPITAAGYVEVKPQLLLALLSLGIDYLIILWQNKEYLRGLLLL